MKSFLAFFKTVKYEFLRVARNKVVATMLVMFSVVLLMFLSFVKIDTKQYSVAIFTDGLKIEQLDVTNQLFKDTDKNKIIYVKSIDQGKRLVNTNKVTFFIALNSEEDPVTATLYYDGTSIFGKSVRETMQDKTNQYSYDKITEYMEEWGVVMDQSYFKLVNFESATEQNVTFKQMPFTMEVGICLAIILTFGLAYSLSRDNETNVSKNISFMPIGLNKYLLSKVFVYFVLGVAEFAISLLFGILIFKLNYQLNFAVVLLMGSFFLLAVIMLGLLFGLMKSQISTVLCNMLSIILPLFALIIGHLEMFPILLRIILYCCPITPLVSFLNAMIFNGIIIWPCVIIFVVQIVGYYLLTLLILRHRVKR